MKAILKFILFTAAVMAAAAGVAALFKRHAEKIALEEYDGEAMFIG